MCIVQQILTCATNTYIQRPQILTRPSNTDEVLVFVLGLKFVMAFPHSTCQTVKPANGGTLGITVVQLHPKIDDFNSNVFLEKYV